MNTTLKKLWCVIAGACMMISLSACSTKNIDNAALSAFGDALANLIEQDSLAFTAEITGDQIPYVPETNKFYGNIITKNNDLQLSFQPAEESIAQMIQLYIKDGALYSNLMGVHQKQKLAIASDDIQALKESTSYIRAGIAFLKPYLSSVTAQGDEVHIYFDMDKLNETAEKQYGNNLTYDEFSLHGVIDNETLTSLRVDCMANGIVEEKQTELNLSINITIDAVNQIDVIDFPDFSDYQADSSSFS